jgi:hypothetical protein
MEALRAVSRELRRVVESQAEMLAVLEADRAAERALRERLELRLAELERRRGMDSSSSSTPVVEGAGGREGAAEGGAGGVPAGAVEGAAAGA